MDLPSFLIEEIIHDIKNTYQLICIYKSFTIIGFLLWRSHISLSNHRNSFFGFLQELQGNLNNKQPIKALSMAIWFK